jgi:5-hydroxyisourate hydrolase
MKTRSPITTHVLDLGRGKPAAGLAVRLERKSGSAWTELARGSTDADGRLEGLLPAGSPAEKGVYRLCFETGAYYGPQSCFYPRVAIEFELSEPSQHHHVPLLLNQFGYSTYRGS